MRKVDKPRLVPAAMSRTRSHTRTLLIDAALALFGDGGMRVPTIHEIAARAGVATGTFYNYFRTCEEILEAAIVEHSERLQDDIEKSYARIADPAERVSIGTRRFILQARNEPMWAAGLLRVWGSTPDLLTPMLAPVRETLRAGRRRRRFTYRSEDAAADLIVGTVVAAMLRVIGKRAGEDSGADVAALILRGLGIDADESGAITGRPLPSASDVDSGLPHVPARRRRGTDGRAHRMRRQITGLLVAATVFSTALPAWARELGHFDGGVIHTRDDLVPEFGFAGALWLPDLR